MVWNNSGSWSAPATTPIVDLKCQLGTQLKRIAFNSQSQLRKFPKSHITEVEGELIVIHEARDDELCEELHEALIFF